MPASDVMRTSRRLESIYYPMYTRRSWERQHVFVPPFVQAVSPVFSGVGTLSAAGLVTQQGVVAFSGVGSMFVSALGSSEQATKLDYRPTGGNASLVAAGHDLGEQSECQLGTGTNAATNTTNFGFVDTTYTLSKAQILATYSTAVL